MAEDKPQEEMSMNEILSSIKNILVENGNPAPEAAEPVAAPESEQKDEDVLELGKEDISLADLPLGNTDEDIFNLSPDMKIAEDKNPEPAQTENTILDLDAELANVNLTPEIIDDKGDEDLSLELAAERVEDLPELDAGLTPDEEAEPLLEASAPVIDVDSEPYFEEPKVELGAPAFSPAEEEIAAEIAAPEVHQELPAFETKEIEDQSAEDAFAQQPSAPVVAPAMPEIKNTASVDEDVADVSANIINNFAKMFAQKQEEPAPQPKEEVLEISPIKTNLNLGNGNLTLEDMVKNAIQGLVADWVEDIKSGVNIREIASQEIAAQTKAWLDANLPSIVETIVKKEIERVMVKVGRN